MMIDRKFRILAVNPANGKIYTEKDAMLFVAKDAALVPTLKTYLAECQHLGCNDTHIESIHLLLGRVIEFQANHTDIVRPADTDPGVERDRCIRGILEEDSEG